MNPVITFGLLVLVAGMALGGITGNASALDDPSVLLKIAQRTQEQTRDQISASPSDEINRMFEEGTNKVNALEQAFENGDSDSAKENFLSAMTIFKEILRQLASSSHDTFTASSVDSAPTETDVRDPSNDLQRLRGYVDDLKAIAENYNTSINFAQLDELFVKARQQISGDQSDMASETVQEIKDVIASINSELREEALKQESQQARDYAQKYLEQLDRLIEHAKNQGADGTVIERLETAKANLSSAETPSEIIQEIREIMSLKVEFDLTENDGLESRILQVERTLSRLSQTNYDLEDAMQTLQSIKYHLANGEFDTASYLLADLENQLQESP